MTPAISTTVGFCLGRLVSKSIYRQINEVTPPGSQPSALTRADAVYHFGDSEVYRLIDKSMCRPLLHVGSVNPGRADHLTC